MPKLSIMARDYSKFSIQDLGENFNKGQLVYQVVSSYVKDYAFRWDEIKNVFPDNIQGSLGIVRQKSDIKDFKRYSKQSITSIDKVEFYVCNQWGDNISKFVALATDLGYEISKSGDSDNETDSMEGEEFEYIEIYATNGYNNDDFKLIKSKVVRTNGLYTLSFDLDSDGDGVIDTYNFYDIKTKVSGSNGSPWDFDGFIDENEEWTTHDSFEDFGYDSSEISETLYNMKLDFVSKYLNEASQENILYEAAVPFNKRDIFNIVTFSSGANILVFESGNKDIILNN